VSARGTKAVSPGRRARVHTHVRAVATLGALRVARVALAALLALVTLAPRESLAADLTLWHAYRDAEQAALESVIRDFEVRTGHHVAVLAVPFDAYGSKLAAAIPNGNGPDLFIEAHERLGTYLRDRLLDPVPATLDAGFDGAAKRALTAGGALYGLPLAAKSLALFVDRGLVKGPVVALDDLPLAPDGYALAYENESSYAFAPFVHGAGASFLRDDGTFGFVGSAARRALEDVLGLARSGRIPTEASGALVSQLFRERKAAAMISGPWALGEIGDRAGVEVVPLPPLHRGGAPLRPFLTVEALFFAAGRASGEPAQALARAIAHDEGARVRTREGLQVVPRTTLDSDDAQGPRAAALAAFRRAAREAVPMPSTVAMRATWEPIGSALKAALRGDLDAERAAAMAERRFRDVTRPLPERASTAPWALALGLTALAGAFLALRRAREERWSAAFQRSLPAYLWVTHAAVILVLLVGVPLVVGAGTSFFAGPRSELRFVGAANYLAIATARGGELLGVGSFWRTLLVTLGWTAANVTLHVAIGVTLGLVLSRPLMRLKTAYRVLLVLPWAVPSYVSALAWKGMFHRQFGAVNALLVHLGAEPVSWFARFSTAFAANVATNVWLGFPFFMVVTIGALTSLPQEVLEAAAIDGAGRWQRFRYVIAPLLLPALLPSVILGTVWTFNQFNVVCLVSGGEPDGATDILVSEAYHWAFTRDAQIGYGAAYAVMIFLLLVVGTRALDALGKKASS
jgi:arabinogalactan oligomer/maltooligosaccharide transport system permease protein